MKHLQREGKRDSREETQGTSGTERGHLLSEMEKSNDVRFMQRDLCVRDAGAEA